MRILTLIFAFISWSSFGQVGHGNESFVFKKFSPQYDSVISYSRDCYPGTNKLYTVLGLKDGQAELITLTEKSKVKKENLNRNDFNSLIDFWTANQFWTIKNDSLNKVSYSGPDGDKIHLSIADGCTDSFEIFDKKNYKQFEAYEADNYQKKIFRVDRESFIKCRDYFVKRFVK